MHDYHIHTKYCRHATGEMRDYVDYALKLGFDEIGFSDHYPMYFFPIPPPADDLSMSLKELPQYISDVKNLRELYHGKIGIKLGIELDYVSGKEEFLRKELTKNRFDYVYGSIHLIDDWIVDHPRFIKKFEETSLDQLYSRYFDLMKALIKSKIFDIVSHIDVLKRFGYTPAKGYSPLLIECLDLIAENDMVLEINTSGLDNIVEETYPGRDTYKKLVEKDIPVLLGSDAHAPDQVGRHFRRTLELLKRAGVSQLVVFENRRKTYVEI